MNRNSIQTPLSLLSRRSLLGGIGLLSSYSLLPNLAYSQAVSPLELPLKLVTLTHHIGISVEDVLLSAEFYSRLVGGDNVMGEKEPFLRYFINLNPGQVAIGKIGTLGGAGATVPFIDHYCLEAEPYNEEAWHARLEEEGYNFGGSGILFDHDNIPIQVAGAEAGGESLAAGEVTQLESLFTGKPLITTMGYDHIMLRVSDADKTADFYQRVFGLKPTSYADGKVWISDGNVHLGWRETLVGESPGIEYYGLRTEPFDIDSFGRDVEALGAKSVEGFDAGSNAMLFSDPDGIKLGLVSV